MNMKLKILFVAVFVVVGFCSIVFAVIYFLLIDGSRLVGQNQVIIIFEGNIQSLEYFVVEYQMGFFNMMEANSGVDIFLSKGGIVLNISQQLILSDIVYEGIVINSVEMRFYYYSKGINIVIVLSIGIGQLGKDTFINWIIKVERKKVGSIWTSIVKMYVEYRVAGESFSVVVSVGSDNSMGLYVFYIGRLYVIYGINVNFGIGLRVSYGCVRLRNEDIKFLFEKVSVGIRVQFIDESVKAIIELDGSRYIEVYNSLFIIEVQFEGQEIVLIILTKSVQIVIGQLDVDQVVFDEAIKNRFGMSVRLN